MRVDLPQKGTICWKHRDHYGSKLGSDHLSVCTLVTLNLKESWQLNLCHYQLCCKQKGCSTVPSSKWFYFLEHPGVPIALFSFIHSIGKSTQSSLKMYVEFAIRNIIMLAGITNLKYTVNFEFYTCSFYYLKLVSAIFYQFFIFLPNGSP